jgi:molecular chaperone Hsp33
MSENQTSSRISNRWVKCISTEGNIRGVAIQAADLIQSLADRHQIKTTTGIRGLGEAVIGALLVASYCKHGQRINLNIRGSGFYQQALVDAYPEGSVRGFVIERDSAISHSDVGPWGVGLLSVLRTKDVEGEQPYIGTVPLITGHLAKDLSFYWVQSEQIPSAVGLAIDVQGDRVVSAGGFLVQALPGASQAEVKLIEQHIHELGSLAKSLAEDGDPLHLLSQIFQSTAFILIEEKEVQFKCNCSRERVQRAVALVGVEELQAMLDEDRAAVVHCDFCAAEYKLDENTLKELIQSVKNR